MHPQNTQDQAPSNIERSIAWVEYRDEYGASTQEHKAFCAGWDAALGRLDIGGVQR